MLIAQEKRKTNIAEYILYLWQVEDLLRSCSFNPATIDQHLVSRYSADENKNHEISDWYNNLSLMMEKERVQESGHLQVLVNLVNDLNEFHLKLIINQADPEYFRLYQKNHEAIAEFMKKSGSGRLNEVEVCLNALYGVVLLKLKNAEISPETKQTIAGFGQLIGHLSARYIQFENDDFEF
jgi:hypothetical protein